MNPPTLHRVSNRSGFTVVEVLLAAVILGLVLTVSTASLVFVVRNERMAAAQSDLDLDASLLVERLRADLWRTARSEILLYPPGPGPYQAISFPIVEGTNPIIRQDDGSIAWDSTIIYHKELEPSQVLRTVIPSYDPDPDGREDELGDVVDAGSTYTAGGATTRVLIQNPVQWELNINGTGFDAYSPAEDRRDIRLGRAIMDDGPNRLTFRVDDQNPSSSGYGLGVDTLTVYGSGLPLEAEHQNVVASGAGPQPTVENMGSNDLWSVNSRLGFAAMAVGDEFTLQMDNDGWEERAFFGDGVKYSDVVRLFRAGGTQPNAYGLRLDGNGTNWFATNQTRSLYWWGGFYAMPTSMAVRVFVRGSDIVEGFDGGWIGFNGTNVWARFSGSLAINGAFIAESVAPADFSRAMDYIPETRRDFLFGGSLRASINSSPWTIDSGKTAFMIDRDKSYVVGVHFTNSVHAYPYPKKFWAGPSASTNPSCFYITDIPTNDLHGDWSGRADMVATTNILVLESFRTGYSPEGLFTSQVIDTKLENPSYDSFTWDASQPSNSVVELRVRGGTSNDMSDATAWTNIVPAQMGLPPGIYGRYAQVQIRMMPGIDALTTPEVRNFTLSWAGGRRYVDLSGIFATGPDHGVYEVLVNGFPMVQEVNAYIEVIRDYTVSAGKTNRLVSSAFAEIVPRN